MSASPAPAIPVLPTPGSTASEATTSELRHEIKFVGRATEVQRLLTWVRTHAAAFDEPYPSRRVNNVYFDTHSLAAFRENLAGGSRRMKLRYRWYGDTFEPARGTLEVKRRRAGIGWKQSFRAPGVSLPNASWSAVRRQLRAKLGREARLWLDASPLPVILNRYDRRYFLSRDGRVRLTVDWNQRVYDQRFGAAPNLRRASNLPATLVVELKFALPDHSRAREIVQSLPLRLSRNSKYVLGVQAGATR